MRKETENWYVNWFNTDFYHTLYQDRNHKEARLFMDNLIRYLKLPKGSGILDLACGKGRHAIYLNALGYDVTGIDLSGNNIAFAQQFANETLHFDVHNMCVPYHRQFDAVFNLFTSFGYFDRDEDNLNTVRAIKANLKAGGYGVIDFMNVDYVADTLISEDSKTVDGIVFHQKREFKDGYIVKEIRFRHDHRDYCFTERVKALRLSDFELYFKQSGIVLSAVFGDYRLGAFDPETSERLILIFT
ncbi:MAG: class I SAM-dependent methyltransferase [Sinomicrobium sp.]|nr:class I SAM-dependent methyltransferase [Sinomicrobium sp.]